MDANALLLNDGVVAGGVHIQAAGQRDGAKGTVGRQRHIVSLRHGGNFLHLGQAAGVAQVGLDDIHAAGLQKALEIILGKQALTGGNGDVARGGDFFKAFHVFAQDRLLDEHGIKFFQLFGQDLCHGLVNAAVKINGNRYPWESSFLIDK